MTWPISGFSAMFDFRKHLARRASISHQGGELHIAIQRRNNPLRYIVLLALASAIYLLLLFRMGSAILQFIHEHSPAGVFFLAFFAGVFTLVLFIVAITALWNGFGSEEIVISNRTLYWTQQALQWKRDFHIELKDIKDVIAITPWYARDRSYNRVELSVKGRTYTFGEHLLREEATEIALTLRHAAKLPVEWPKK